MVPYPFLNFAVTKVFHVFLPDSVVSADSLMLLCSVYF